MRNRVVLILIVLVFCTMGIQAAHADTMYYYTGNAYTSFAPDQQTASPAVGTHLQASVTFSSAVTSDYNGQVPVGDVVSWSITSGPTKISSSTGTALEEEFTLVNGAITQWTFQAGDYNSPPALSIDMFTTDEPTNANTSNLDYATVPISQTTMTEGSNLNTPGTWTCAVPEPSSALLLVSGIIALAGLRRKLGSTLRV